MWIRQLHALFLDTLRDAWSRKLILATVLSSALSSGLLLWYMRTLSSRAPHAALTILAEQDPRYLDNAFALRDILAATASMGFWTQVGFTIMLMAGAMAMLLAPERNAMIAASAVPRGLILPGRFLGCLFLTLVGITLTFGTVFAACGLQYEVWHWRFLGSIGTAWLAAGATLALLALIQVMANSVAVGTVLLVATAVVSVGAQYPERVREVTGSPAVASLFTMIGSLLPRSGEIAHWTSVFVYSGVTAQAMPLYATAAGAAVMLVAASVVYTRKEF
ncbi:MAG: hypothetical protein JNL98_04155 [Bryobacterales bacterium]|nr:hypothetical protein [Bryobacterales bacterium]